MWTLHYFNFKSNYDVLKSKSQRISLIKSINLNKNETELKMENPTNTFRENLELANKKIGHFLYRLFCPKEIFFNICVLSQCVVYWIQFQNMIYIYISYSEMWYLYISECDISETYHISHIRNILHIFYISKNITSYTFLLVFEIVESLQCILKEFVQRGSIFF